MGYELGHIRTDRGEFKDKGNQVFDVTNPDFGGRGAKGDGVTDDTLAIQDAIAAAIAAGGGTVFFPLGTYLLNGTRQESYLLGGSLLADTLLVIDSNVRLMGSGYGSVLKVADNYTDGGGYRVIGSASLTTNNVEICHLRINGNGLNNLVAGSTGSDLRRAYMVDLRKGDNLYVHDCWFHECPGRAALNLGNNGPDVYDWTNVRIQNNYFWDMGGGIEGNGAQNDHSSIYLQANGADVSGNFLWNTTQPDPFTNPTKAIVALEIHGKNTEVHHNQVHNYGGGGNIVATITNNSNTSWHHNRFTGMTSNILKFYATGGHVLRRVSITHNVIEVDNLTYNGGTGIYQGPTENTAEIEGLTIEDNTIYGTTEEPKASVTTNGIGLLAVEGGSIKRNRLQYIQGCGISVEPHPTSTTLNFRGVDIDDNTFIDCGIHTTASRIWGIRIENTSDAHEVANINVRRNKVKRTLQAVDETPWAIRGIRLVGAGRLRNIRFEDNEFEDIPNPTLRYDFSGVTAGINVTVMPRAIANVRTADPTFGIWENAYEYVHHSNPAASGFAGKVVTTAGAGSSALWGTATAYKVGDWIRTSGNKVLRCVTAGTSDASTEPNPTTLGIVLADGTVEWVYIASSLAVFKTFGAISA